MPLISYYAAPPSKVQQRSRPSQSSGCSSIQAVGSFRRPEPNGSEVGLVAPIDLETLSGIAQNLYNVGLSEGTHATYSAPINRFIDFTYQTGLRALPVEEEALILFVAHLSSHYKNGFSRIRTAVFSVQSFQVDNNCHFGDVSIGYIAFSRVSNGATGNPTIKD